MEFRYKILLATDYSEAVKYAEEYAVQFTKKINGTLAFLHAYQFPMVETPARPMEYGIKRIEYDKTQFNFLQQHRDELLRSMNIQPEQLFNECIVRESSAIGATIIEEAESLKPDFIIVGTHGATGLRKVFFGSHAWEIIRKSSLPVLAIPSYTAFTEIKNIVFATEYRKEEIPIINYLVEIAGKFDAEVMVVHVTNYALTKKFENEMLGIFRQEIKNKISYNRLDIVSYYHEDIEKGLNNFCFKTKADWLVMLHKKSFLLERLFLKRVSKKMSFETKTPLLVIPDSFKPGRFFEEKLVSAFNKDYSDEEF